ncbi:glycosyltransferase family 2 protein [Pseudorhodoferax sp.]|uniref:glycosyltransferase family 2 protein n=1 Tax=Pseudorhodoferax sp. TaxID=1993553 RepID=UPI0039E30283
MQDTLHRPITVSIVSHGQQELLLPLLEQLGRHCATSIAKVILTINIPEADLLAQANLGFAIERIVNIRPQGFGANHNAAFAHCESDWFLVLNPDIRLDNDVLQTLLARARVDSGVLTPRIVEPGRNAPEPHRGLLTPREILLRNRRGYCAPPNPAWIPGMFMLLRAAAYRQIDGFDTRFFMYGEDFDLCARLQLAGWHIQVAEELQVQHAARRASRRDMHHLCWHCESLIKVWTSATFWRYRSLWHMRGEATPSPSE